jgi:uncharacterized membrane protein
LGTFHPLIVHLPIGILLLNAVFVFLSKTKRYAALSAAIPVTLLLGAISAVAACVTGWLLSQSGEYTVLEDSFGEGVLSYHKWMGIAVATASCLLYLSKKHQNTFVWLLLIAGISVTGHYGGTLTHGEGYLFGSQKGKITERPVLIQKMPSDIQEALVFKDLIKPILKEKCFSCHNNAKQKGKLNMETQEAFLKGGENGAIAVAGQAANSEMMKRIHLDIEDKHHMSPKGKTQPTAQDITLLEWWINAGLPFDKKVKDVPQTDAVKTIFANFNLGVAKKENPFIPTAAIEKADNALMDSIRKKGILLMPVAPNSNYLQANFVSLPKASDAEVALLLPFAKQLIWLKLGNTKITDAATTTVGKLTNLTRLSLENTAITNNGLANIAALSQLQYLNLVGTNINSDGLGPLSNLSSLKEVFLFKTVVSSTVLSVLKQKMPQTVFDTGGYIVPKWTSDTAVFKKISK